MSLDFKIVNITLIILNLYKLAKNYSNFSVKKSGVEEIKDIFYINSL